MCMEELAKELRDAVDNICGGFHYYKDENVLSKSQKLAEHIQKLCGTLLQGNVFGMEREEYQELAGYVIQVLEDYIEALNQRDMVWMLDTLDYGLRELLNIYINRNPEETGYV